MLKKKPVKGYICGEGIGAITSVVRKINQLGFNDDRRSEYFRLFSTGEHGRKNGDVNFTRGLRIHFEQRFWGTKELNNLYLVIDTQPEEQQGLANIFHTAYKEYTRFLKRGTSVSLEPIERAMQIDQAKEAIKLEKGLPLFASVGSIAPYVGLFGTVMGIIPTLQALGQAQQATIALVAPGLSEALIATALGLFTAIPSVIAYNRFSVRANDLLDRYQLFQDELLSLIDSQTQDLKRG